MTPFDYGPVVYNGVEFATGLKARCRMETVYSRSGRKVKYVKYTLLIDGIVTADDCNLSMSPGEVDSHTPGTTDEKMAVVRSRLLREGGHLQANNIGLGFDLDINPVINGQPVGTTTNLTATPPVIKRTDVVYGPKPRMLDWEPIGANAACRIQWQVEFHLSQCVFPDTDIAQFEYSMVWSIGEAGLTTRSITGIIEVAGNIVDGFGPDSDGRVEGINAKITNDANKYRPLVELQFPLVEGFSRSQQYALSDDKRTLRFNLADRELDTGGNPLYPGTIEADVTYDTRNKGEMVMMWFASTLSGSITVKAGANKKIAYAAFLVILASKLQRIDTSLPHKQGFGENWGDSEETKLLKKGVNFILHSFNVSEEIFGRSVSFSVTWSYVCDFEKVISIAGHFEKLDGTKNIDAKILQLNGTQKQFDWTLWKHSISNVQDSGGYQDMGFLRDKELLVGFCDRHQRTAYEEKMHREEDTSTEPLLKSSIPEPSASYMYMQQYIEVMEDTQSRHQVITKKPEHEPYKPQKDESKTNFQSSDADKDGGLIKVGGGGTHPSEHEVPADKVISENPVVGTGAQNKVTYRRSDSTFALRIQGMTVRAGRPSPVPYVFEVDGKETKLRSRKVKSGPTSRSNCPIWVTTWDLVYDLEQEPIQDIAAIGKGPEMYGHQLSEGII